MGSIKLSNVSQPKSVALMSQEPRALQYEQV